VSTETSDLSVEWNRRISRDAARQMIVAWLLAYLSALLAVPRDEIDDAKAFERYGMDSSAAVALAADLSEWLGYTVDPAITYDYSTIGTLADELSCIDGVRSALGRSLSAQLDG